MACLKHTLIHHLTQLKTMMARMPASALPCSLAPDMFSLEKHAKVAANFALRGYCPLLGVATVSFYTDKTGTQAVLSQIEATLAYLAAAPEIEGYQDQRQITDTAGLIDVTLCESEFIERFILPNLLFHMGMVYAIGKTQGVSLSKGDFDGFHHYPPGFCFSQVSQA